MAARRIDQVVDLPGLASAALACADEAVQALPLDADPGAAAAGEGEKLVERSAQGVRRRFLRADPLPRPGLVAIAPAAVRHEGEQVGGQYGSGRF